MKHLKKNRKFGRSADYRKSFLSNLVNALVEKERIRTTEARAKEIRSFVEKAVSRAKNDTLANRRLLLKRFNPKTVTKLFLNLAPRFKERKGGYSRIIKLGFRKNDSAKMAIIELLES